MSSDRLDWTEAQLDARLGISCVVGQSVGYEQAAGFVLKEASALFAIGQDDKAKLLRELSGKLKELSVAERRRQKELQVEYDARYKD